MAEVRIRPACGADAEAIAQVYAEGIVDRVATFETRPWTPHDFRDDAAA